MKYLNYKVLLLIIGVTLSSTVSAQRQNDHWTFGNNEWRFDDTQNNGFQRSELATFAGHKPATVSDPETGELLFYTNGLTVYDRNGSTMNNGDQLAGIPASGSILERFYEVAGYCGGNRTNQGTLILPRPGSESEYYVFTSVRTAFQNCEGGAQYNEFYDFGIQYAIVDMDGNGGLGVVTSKHNSLSSEGRTAITATTSNNGFGIWLVTASNSNFNSYKIDSNGISSPVISSNPSSAFQSIKISKDGSKLAGSVYNYTPVIFDFNNTTGTVSNLNDFLSGNIDYIEQIGSPSAIEFSEDGNILYFLTSFAFSSNDDYNYGAAIAMYNLTSGQVAGGYFDNPSEFFLPDVNEGMVMQRADNDKIYIQFYKIVTPRFYPIENDIWGVIENPNVWNPTMSPISTISTPNNVSNLTGFPQLIPGVIDGCVEDLVITDPVLNGEIDIREAEFSLQASNIIFSGAIADYRAGEIVSLLPGFQSRSGSDFRGYIAPCTNGGKSQNHSKEYIVKSEIEIKEQVQTGKSLKIFPNPTHDQFTISSEDEMLEWHITNQLGTLQQGNRTSLNNAKKVEVNISNYPPGVYYVTAIFKDGEILQKLLVKE